MKRKKKSVIEKMCLQTECSLFLFTMSLSTLPELKKKKKKKVELTNKNSLLKQSHEFFCFPSFVRLCPTVCMKGLHTTFFRVVTWLISFTFTKATYSFFYVLTSIIVNTCSLFHIILKFANRFIPRKRKEYVRGTLSY